MVSVGRYSELSAGEFLSIESLATVHVVEY